MIRMFAPITKIDVAKREVWGRLAHEVPDRAKEIFDYTKSKPYFEQWSDEFAKSTVAAGQEMSMGNLRAMHGKVAAGKFIAVNFNDAEKAIDVGAKVVDDAEWNKCLEGVYRGFSIGGDYVGDKVAEKIDGVTHMRYVGRPSEGSLVDSPCIPTCTFFQVLKADGSTMQKNFVEKTKEQLAAEHNARTEKVARGLARKVFYKQPRSLQAALPDEVFEKMEKKEQDKVINLRGPDRDWTNYVTDAIRLIKSRGDDMDEEDLERPDDIDPEEWDDMTYEEKLEALDKAVEVQLKKDRDVKYPKPDDYTQEDWDPLSDEMRGKVLEGIAQKSKKTEIAKKAEADAVAQDEAALKKAAEAKEKEELEKAQKTGAKPSVLSDVDKLAQLMNDGKVTPTQLLAVAEKLTASGVSKREFSEEQREAAADSGSAMPDGSYPIKNVSDLKNAVQAFGRASDKEATKAHIKARAKALGAEDQLPDKWEESRKSGITKDLYNVQNFAAVLQSLSYICASAQRDCDIEKDDSPIPDQLRGWIKSGVLIFQDMADEESNELMDTLQEKAGDADVMAMAHLATMHKVDTLRQQLEDPDIRLSDFVKVAREAIGDEEWVAGGYFQKYVEDPKACIHDILTKAGARHSAVDKEHLQQAHDHLCKLGAMCDKDNMGADDMAEKSVGAGTLLKQMTTYHDDVKKMNDTIDGLQKELKELKDQPVRPRGVVRAIPKGGDDPEYKKEGMNKKDEPSALAKAVQAAKPGEHNPALATAMVADMVKNTAAFRRP